MLPSEAAALAAHAHARSAARTALTLGSAPAARRPSVENSRASGPGLEVASVDTNHEADPMDDVAGGHAKTSPSVWRPDIPSPPARGPQQKDGRRPTSAYDLHGISGPSSLSPNQDHISERPIVGTTLALTSPTKPTSVRSAGPVRRTLLSSRAAPGQSLYSKRVVDTASPTSVRGHEAAGEATSPMFHEQPVSSQFPSLDPPVSTEFPQLVATESFASMQPPPPPPDGDSDGVGATVGDDESHFMSQEQARPLLSHDSLASIPPPPPGDDTASDHMDSPSEAAEVSSHVSLQPRPIYYGFGSFASLPPPPPMSDEESDTHTGTAGRGFDSEYSWRQPSDISELNSASLSSTAAYVHGERCGQAGASTQEATASMEGTLRTVSSAMPPAAGRASPGDAAEFISIARPAEVVPQSSPSLLAARAFSCAHLCRDMNSSSAGVRAGAGAGPDLHEFIAPTRGRQAVAHTVKVHTTPSAGAVVASSASPLTRPRRTRSSDTRQLRDEVEPGKRRGSLLHERIAATWKYFVGDADTVVVLNPAFDVLQAMKRRDIGMARYLRRRRASTPMVVDGVGRAADGAVEHFDARGTRARGFTHTRPIMLPPHVRTFATQLAITRRLMAMQQYVLDQRMLLNHFENRRLARELAAAQNADSPHHISVTGSSHDKRIPGAHSFPSGTTQHGLPAGAISLTFPAAPPTGPTPRLHGSPEALVPILPERTALRAALQQVDDAAAASARLGNKAQPFTSSVPHSLPGQRGTNVSPQHSLPQPKASAPVHIPPDSTVDVDPLAAIGLLPASGSESATKPSSSRRHPGEMSPSAAVLMSQLRSAQEGSLVRGRAAQGRLQ